MFSKVKIIAGILTSSDELFTSAIGRLEVVFGRIDFVGERHPFVHTNYYEDEMGKNLFRKFISFENLFEPHRIASLKIQTQQIEDEFRVDGSRHVNIDAGYIDSNKVVLVTGKHGGHKIAVSEGVWADMLLWYNKGWQALPWAFPDFRNGTYFDEFTKIRTIFKKQISRSIKE